MLCLRSQSPNRTAEFPTYKHRDANESSNNMQWFTSNSSRGKKKAHDSIPLLCTRVLSPISRKNGKELSNIKIKKCIWMQ